LAVYPYLLPVVALPAIRRLRPGRHDVAWALAFAATAALSLVQGRFDPDLLGILLAYAVFTGSRFFAARAPASRSNAVGIGLASGTLMLAGVAAIQAIGMGASRAPGPGWFGHTNIFAHSVLVIGAIAASCVPRRYRVVPWLGALVAILLTGSRSGLAAFGLASLLALVFVRDWRRTAATVLVGGSLGAIVLLVAYQEQPWAQRLSFPIVQVLGIEGGDANLLLETDDLADPRVWNPLAVSVLPASDGGARAPATWNVRRTESAAWARPQQVVLLRPDTTYTLSGEFRASDGAEPGFILWSGDGIDVAIAIANGDARILRARGVDQSDPRSIPLADRWQRIEYTFRLAGDRDAEIAIGPSPDLGSSTAGVAVDVRAMQLEVGPEATAYSARPHVWTGRGEALARPRYWRVAVAAIAEAPWLGHGGVGFEEFYASRADPGEVLPTDAHNLVLDEALQGGVIGILALVALVAALTGASTGWGRSVLAAVLLANLVDSTLFAAVILFPLAALVGIDAGPAGDPVVGLRYGPKRRRRGHLREREEASR
jgi:O-antigen ligase